MIDDIGELLDLVRDLKHRVDGLKADYDKVSRDLRDCRNELCLRCGDYKQRHLGACDGCRWKEADNA